MKLDVLASRDVAETPRVLLGYRGQGVELPRIEHPLRHLDPEHVHVTVLPLPVGAAHEAERPPLIGPDFAALKLLQRDNELVDVVLVGERESCSAEGPGIVDRSHHRAPAACDAVRGSCQTAKLPMTDARATTSPMTTVAYGKATSAS